MGDQMLAHEGRYDVIVIGAGLSGLSSAKLLHDQGLKVLVLEASERVGGRLHTHRNEKCRWVDWGGAYIGPTQTRVLRLAKEMGLEMYKVHNTGDWLYYNNGVRKRFSNTLPPMRHPLAWIDANNIFRKIDELGSTVPVAEPWKAKNADEMDKMSLQEWLNKNVWTQGAMDAVKGFARVNFTAEPHEVSLLWALWYVRQAGGTVSINVTENGAQEMKFEGGAGQLPEKLAEKLGIGSRVLLHHPVCKISHSANGATISTTNRKHFETDYVIFGNPPMLQMKIEFQPSLPAVRNQLIQRVPMGAIIKTMVYYKSPFWREKGLVGTIFVDDPDPTLPVIGTMDDTKSDGTHACIMGFVLCDKSREMLNYTKEERLRVITECYARVFGLQEFLNPVHYEEKNWMADPWTGGCYTGFMGPGFLTKFGPALRKPLGRLYFAGTEAATEWTGYMEGAIQSGERAAREVLCDLGKVKISDVWQREPENPDYPTEEISPSFVEKNLPSVPGLLKAGTALGAAAITRSILKSKV